MTAADRGLGWPDKPDRPDQRGAAASLPETVGDAALGEQAPQHGD